jgi:hypothetical protein
MSSRRKYSTLYNFLPFGALVIAAYVGLAQFRKIDYTHKKNEPVVYKDQLRKLGISDEEYHMQSAKSRDEEIKKIIEETAKNEWNNVRGPRPWEENTEFEEAKKKRVEQLKNQANRKS